MLVSCGGTPSVSKIKADFLSQHPTWQVHSVGVGEGDTSAATLNLLRAFTKGGFADLDQVHAWNQEFVASSPEGRRYEVIASEIERALRFMEA